MLNCPSLSLVVASQGSRTHLHSCLKALENQLPPGEMEVFVVCGSGSEAVSRVAAEFTGVHFLLLSGPTNIPRLWSAGVRSAHGKIIALTIENCVPSPDWATQILRAHRDDCSAIGGAIEVHPDCSVVDWSIYFSRYSAYMLPFAVRSMDDLAADNCSYKRESLDRVNSLLQEGFWETFIHQDMRRRNDLLVCHPAPVVTYCGGISGWTFVRRRFTHGRYFAARRGASFTPRQRLTRAALFFLVPAVLVLRIVLRVWRKRRHRAKFIQALPFITCFAVAWAIGESAGYLASLLTGNLLEPLTAE